MFLLNPYSDFTHVLAHNATGNFPMISGMALHIEWIFSFDSCGELFFLKPHDEPNDEPHPKTTLQHPNNSISTQQKTPA